MFTLIKRTGETEQKWYSFRNASIKGSVFFKCGNRDNYEYWQMILTLFALKWWRYAFCMPESLTESLGGGGDIKSTNLPSNFFFELDFMRETFQNMLLFVYKISPPPKM